MAVTTFSFLCFFPIAVLTYYVIPNRFRRLWLLAVSYYFYMSWDARFAFALLWITAVTYCGAFGIAALGRQAVKAQAAGRLKKVCMFLCAVMVFGTLFYCKYAVFVIGASFYTLQSFGYLMDVYRGKTEPERNFLRYALFLSFFPTVVSGPIERSDHLLRQLQMQKQTEFRIENVKQGLWMMLWGYFMKLVIAERIAVFVNAVFDRELGGVYAIVAAMLYGIQIYCDFAGYSVIAAGAAKTLGFSIITNFEAPYLAVSVSDFWRRWHMSLTGWFRDYLYIPLGGNRRGRLRKYCNIMIVFIVSGIWHGNGWKYLIWGGLNGFYQVVGDALKPVRKRLAGVFRLERAGKRYRLLQAAATFLLVDFAWIFFRADSAVSALKMIRSMAVEFDLSVLWDGSLYQFGIGRTEFLFVILTILLLAAVDLLHDRKQDVLHIMKKWHWTVRVCLSACVLMAVLIFGVYGEGYNVGSFIYFAF